MNDREKLVELLGHLEYQYCQSHSIMRENVVDYLISNGVTIREPGKWVVNTDDFTPAYRCSVCGYNKPMIAGEGVSQGAMNFCPNCGAPMKGESNEH